jgi:hypothetical protein
MDTASRRIGRIELDGKRPLTEVKIELGPGSARTGDHKADRLGRMNKLECMSEFTFSYRSKLTCSGSHCTEYPCLGYRRSPRPHQVKYQRVEGRYRT